MLCDTNGGSMPEEVAALTKEAAAAVDVPLGIHSHNDCELAVANSLAAVDAGAVHVQGTINGLGERCGNADLISVIANLALKKQGYEVLGGDGVEHLTELSRYVYEIANMHFRTNQPFVGPSAFAHKGGMHVHAVTRAAQSYEHIAPEAVGNERRVLVSELSGRSNIVALTAKHNLQHDSALMEQVLPRGRRAGEPRLPVRSGRGVVRSAGAAGGRHVPARTSSCCTTTSTSKPTRDGRTITEATVKLRVGDEVRHEVAEGDGPVNALDAALRKALNGHFPNLARHAPGRLQGPRHQLRGRHRRRRPRGDRKPGRRRQHLGHRRRQREHHRSQLGRPGRQHRVQTVQGSIVTTTCRADCVDDTPNCLTQSARLRRASADVRRDISDELEMDFKELPSQYDHAAAQAEVVSRSGKSAATSTPRPNDPRREPFTIVIPPPNVTGALHLGHALNNTLQDILIRMKRMQGFNTLWMPGTDHAGIATQAVVERRLFEEEKKTRHDLGREGLVERIWEWKDQYEARILGQLKQLGCSCDWQRTRFTLDEHNVPAPSASRSSSLFKDGKIYRGKRLVNWDTFLQTAVSDDEVFHETDEGPLLALQVPGDRPASPASRRTSRSPPRGPRRCSATRPWPCIPTRPPRSTKPKPSCAKNSPPRPPKKSGDIQKQIDALGGRRQAVLPQLDQLPRHGTGAARCSSCRSPAARFRSSPTNGPSPSSAPAA